MRLDADEEEEAFGPRPPPQAAGSNTGAQQAGNDRPLTQGSDSTEGEVRTAAVATRELDD
jgi:hypothetical protein